MDHLSADRLAALATDPTVSPDPAEVEHLAGCRACRDDVTELGAVAHDVREAQPTGVAGALLYLGTLPDLDPIRATPAYRDFLRRSLGAAHGASRQASGVSGRAPGRLLR